MAKLILVTTPIGNLEDFSPRSLRAIEQCEFLAVEDTRSFRALCSKLGLPLKDKQVFSFHDHSDQDRTSGVIKTVLQGKDVAVISEAGSPLISDPAYPLVVEAIAQGIEVDSVGSTSAVICALELSGLHPIPFHFHGFPPRDQGKRISYFESLLTSSGTHIFFEGQSRVEETVMDLVKVDPSGKFAIGRELTKAFQSIYRFDADNVKDVLSQVVWKGEFVLLWQNDAKTQSSGKLVQLAEEILEGGAHPKKLGKLLAQITGQSPKHCYDRLLKSKE